MSPSQFAEALIAYCGWSHASVTSYGRTPTRNQKVGGVPGSKHLSWLAADVVYDGAQPDLSAAKQRARHLGLLLLREDTHDHLQAL
jgi:hypothetical protein